MMTSLIVAAALLTLEKGPLALVVESETQRIDPGRSVFLTVTLKTGPGTKAELPDIRERARGFAVAEEFLEQPLTEKDGTTVQVANWKLTPEPCAKVYKIAPFAVGEFFAGPVYFDPPEAREPVTGGYEADPRRMLPPPSWRLVGWCALALAGLAALALAVWAAVRFAVRKVREHLMSPIERAWVELDRLLKKGLPGRGRYKDFYVELTMVVRRYVQRKYGIKAPHLTTEEFLAEFGDQGAGTGDQGIGERLRRFLESADLVKFAGVEATPEMADAATDSARGYLKSDSSASGGVRRPSKEGGK